MIVTTERMIVNEPSQTEFQNLIKLHGQKDFAAALREIEALLESFPDSARLRNIQGIFRIDVKQFEAAVVSFKKAIEKNADYFQAFNNMGNALKEGGKLETAALNYIKALTIKPDYFEAHANLAHTRQLQGKLEEAIESYGQAARLKPDSIEVHLNMANALTAARQLEAAVKSYQTVIRLNKQHSDAYFKLSVILLELDRLEEAEVGCLGAIALEPRHFEAVLNLGVITKKLGKLPDAEANYRKALNIKPDSAEAHNNLGNTLDVLGQFQEAEASFRQAIALKPDFAAPYSNLGSLLQKLGRLEDAKVNYKKAIDLNPESSAKHFLAALTGEATNSPPPKEYVETLFDNYAFQFESSLIKKLDYQSPKILAEIILKSSSQNSLGSILDLGCGTGLAGVELKPFCSRLEGVDLSQRMLDKADEKNIYDRLAKRDILDYLTTTFLDFDYFIATDVFNYLGDLSDVFDAIQSRNKSAGKLVFTTEHNNNHQVFLGKTGRYSHSKQYIESLCEQFNFKVIHFEIHNLRKENDFHVKGGLYVLEF